MKRSQHSIKKIISVPVITSSFLGMAMAVPFAFALSSPGSNAAAVQGGQSGQTSTAQVTTADFAKYAYAFNQGYEASLTSASASSTDTGACSEASVVSGGAGSGAAVQSAALKAPDGGGSGGGAPSPKLASMINSYNTYTSMVYNSSSIANTNSNNTVGSNNSTSTDINVKGSKGVMVGVSNDPVTTQLAVNDSFNKDSYNTETTTNNSVVNDSYNTETNTAIASGNTTTINKTEDSNNTKTVNVTKDSNNTSSNEVNTNTTNNATTNTAVGSYNETTVDTNVDVTPQQGPAFPPQNV